ncbi:hypothetical protein Ndes2526B_g05186 [Nannochloris sp. 'desiccata']|nr:hypothetical protein KSW81_000111 [Chlorella desiccata (nom. nud.)]KAH7619941.1 hypothetical protein NADE_008218 [Chlorella desiccata (nom. nud.)]
MSLVDIMYNLRAEIQSATDDKPMVKVHSREWAKIMRGDPVEINPSVGHGFKIMTVEEWAARWKKNEAFPECLNCGSTNTKEHAFTQTWCRGKKKWESESLCLDCHQFSKRSYCDPDFKTPEEYEKERWTEMVSKAATKETAVGA